MSNKNTPATILVAGLTAIVIIVGSWLVGGNQSAPLVGGSSDSGWNATADGCISIDGTCIIGNTGNLDAAATTTITRSYDGFMAGGGIAPASVATGTVLTLYTHAGGSIACDASQSALYADSTAFSPNLVISVGTSTSAAYSTNLIASTTLATTTDQISSGTAHLWTMNAGDRITAFLADGISNASTTNFANWDIEFQTQCWLVGG